MAVTRWHWRQVCYWAPFVVLAVVAARFVVLGWVIVGAVAVVVSRANPVKQWLSAGRQTN